MSWIWVKTAAYNYLHLIRQSPKPRIAKPDRDLGRDQGHHGRTWVLTPLCRPTKAMGVVSVGISVCVDAPNCCAVRAKLSRGASSWLAGKSARKLTVGKRCSFKNVGFPRRACACTPPREKWHFEKEVFVREKWFFETSSHLLEESCFSGDVCARQCKKGRRANAPTRERMVFELNCSDQAFHPTKSHDTRRNCLALHEPWHPTNQSYPNYLNPPPLFRRRRTI